MCHRTIYATAATLLFLTSQPGEFTVDEIRRLGSGFHCDNDEDDVLTVCQYLTGAGMASRVESEDGAYLAFRANRAR